MSEASSTLTTASLSSQSDTTDHRKPRKHAH